MNSVKEYIENKEKKVGKTLKEVSNEYIAQEIKKRKKPLDYDKLNRNIKKCEYCGQQFHPSGLFKHEMYCSLNPDRKNSYETKRKWECRYCQALFLHQKERDLHETRCEKAVVKDCEIDNFDRLRNLKRLFPEIYNLLSPQQIKDFLEGNLETK